MAAHRRWKNEEYIRRIRKNVSVMLYAQGIVMETTECRQVKLFQIVIIMAAQVCKDTRAVHRIC